YSPSFIGNFDAFYGVNFFDKKVDTILDVAQKHAILSLMERKLTLQHIQTMTLPSEIVEPSFVRNPATFL
ncbi:MAG: hypothetical protein OXR68_04140, partial [Alphaproteobacteria bacterium]|nr:hypothetical protein [Alphaproteobacteria bacterium]